MTETIKWQKALSSNRPWKSLQNITMLANGNLISHKISMEAIRRKIKQELVAMISFIERVVKLSVVSTSRNFWMCLLKKFSGLNVLFYWIGTMRQRNEALLDFEVF